MVTGVSTFPRHRFIRLPIAHAAAGARDIAVDGVGQANLDSATLHAAGGV
jgi:hypothetical protein